MIHSSNGIVELHGKAIDILVDISCAMERFLELTPDMLRDTFATGLRASIDLALRQVRSREDDTFEEVSAEEHSDAVNEFIEQIINGYKEEE